MNKVQKLLNIPENMKKRLEEVSREKGVSETAYILFALDEKIRRDENERE